MGRSGSAVSPGVLRSVLPAGEQLVDKRDEQHVGQEPGQRPAKHCPGVNLTPGKWAAFVWPWCSLAAGTFARLVREARGA
jgi:hypothetical protein